MPRLQAAAGEVRRKPGADCDVGEVAVRRDRDAKVLQDEIVAHRRPGERVLGERLAAVVAEAAAIRDELGVADVGQPGQREVAGDVADPILIGGIGVAEGQSAPVARHEDASLDLADLAAFAFLGVVGPDLGAEDDAAVGLAGHLHAEAHLRNGAESVGGLPLVIEEHAAFVVDVVPEADERFAEEVHALGRGGPGGGTTGPRRSLPRLSSSWRPHRWRRLPSSGIIGTEPAHREARRNDLTKR